jgi:membrane protease YdiL (CAAX protease family)
LFVPNELWNLITYVSWILPVAYFIWASNEPGAVFGLEEPRPAQAFGLALPVLLAGLILGPGLRALVGGSSLAESLAPALDPGVARPEGPWQVLLLVISLVVGAFAEELTMRSYLIVRLSTLTGSTHAAILMSAALFSGYHLYQGTTGAFDALAFAALYCFFFARYRRLAPLVIAHALHNVFLSRFHTW